MSDPLGVRNNNPGNIRVTDDQWDGMTGDDGSFVTFETPEYGIRAMTKLLGNYQSEYGLNTLSDMVGRYAPPTENDTASYISFVSEQTGIDPSVDIDMSNPEVAKKIVPAMIHLEQGKLPYTPEQIEMGVSMAYPSGLDQTEEVSAPLENNPEELSESVPPEVNTKALVDYGDLSPQKRFTLAQMKDAEVAQEEMRPGYFEAAKAAMESEWIIPWAVMGDDFTPDPNFTLTESKLKELGEGIPDQYLDHFSGAMSDAHAAQMRDMLLKDLELQRTIDAQGKWTGLGLRVMGAITDPVALAVGAASVAATGGLAAPAVAGQKVSRLGRAISAAVAAGTTEAALSTALVANKPTGEWQDVLVSGLGGFVLGGAFGAMSRGAGAEANAAMSRAGTKALRDIETGALRETEEVALGSTVGAAQSPGVINPLTASAEQLYLDTVTAPSSAYGKLRYDAVGSTGSSELGYARDLAQRLGGEAVGNADGSVSRVAADEVQTFLQRQFEVDFNKRVVSEWRQWMKAGGHRTVFADQKRIEFMEMVTDYVRGDLTDAAEEVKRAGDALADIHEKWLSKAKRPGEVSGRDAPTVKGFADVEYNRNYVMRQYDHPRIAKLYNEFGESLSHDTSLTRGVDSLVARAILNANPEVDTAIAQKLARWHLKKVRGHGAGSDITQMRALSGEDYDALREMLLEEVDEFTPEDVDSLINTLRKKGDGQHARSKQRLLMDENFSMPLKNLSGTETRVIKVKDLLNNNAEDLFNIYNRQMSGAVALANAGFESAGSLRTALSKLPEVAAEHVSRGGKYSNRKMERDVANLEFLGTMVTGTPIGTFGQKIVSERNGWWGRSARMVRDYNFTRVMNQVGFAQLAEFGTAIGENGWKAMIGNMPTLRSFLRDAKTGKLEDEFAEEIESMFGAGTDILRSFVNNRWDEFGSTLNKEDGKLLTRVDGTLAHMKHATMMLSGMGPVNVALQRWAGRGIVQKFTNMAFEGKKLSPASLKRIAASGLSEEQWTNIAKQIRKHSRTERGLINKNKVKVLNFDDWSLTAEGRQAMADLQLSAFRISRKMVQENDPGNMHRWMSTTMGQIFAQFRSFMLVSWAKQSLRGVYHRDMGTFVSWSLGSLAAGLAYAGQTTINSMGRDNQSEYLRERLSAKSIGLASFQRAGWASLIPFGVDNIATPLTGDPIFDYRTTGLSSTIFGNPTWDLMDNAVTGFGSLGRVMMDDEYHFSRENMRNLTSLVPFQNATGLRNGLNLMMEGLPARSEDY